MSTLLAVPLFLLKIFFASPAFLIVGVLSFAHFNSFSWAFLLLNGLLVTAPMILGAKKDSAVKMEAFGIAGLTNILLWTSHWFSTRDLPRFFDNVNLPIQKAGFPFTAFFYPVPPMGGNIPPFHMWPWFFLNALVWFAISWIIVKYFVKLDPNRSQKLYAAFITSGAIIAIAGLGYTLWKFD